jgi:hypothetical protein
MMDLWNKLFGHGPGWYLMGHHLRGGDLYHACSLMPHFLTTHAAGQPVYLVLETGSQASIAALFEECFTKIVIARGFPGYFGGWEQAFAESGLPTFGMNTPIILHPSVSQERSRFSLEFLDENEHFGLTWMQLYKQIMHLPGKVEPVHPKPRPAVAEEARALCSAHGMVPGSSVILCPYAQSMSVQSGDHLAAVARKLENDGYTVFTSVAGTERPVEGTKPITIPYLLLPDVVEEAGWVIAVRSGVCDIVSSVPCRKTFIYQDMQGLKLWSVAAMGLARDAVELIHNFAVGTPDELVSLVMADEGIVNLPTVRDHLSRQIGTGRSSIAVTTLAFAKLDLAPARPSGPAVIRLLDVPRRDHPRMATLIDERVGRFVNGLAGADTRFYACRDTWQADMLEELTTDLIAAGDYTAANSWHSIVAVIGSDVAALLPPPIRGQVQAREPIVTGEPINLAALFKHRAGQDIPRDWPLAFKGFHFGDGWCDLEPWGIWTSGLRSTASFKLAEQPRRPVTITLFFSACISEDLPTLRFKMRVNGEAVSDAAVSLGSEMHMLEFEVAPHIIGDGSCFLSLEFDEVRSPRQQGGHPDDRLLGLGLHWIKVTPQPTSYPHRGR